MNEKINPVENEEVKTEQPVEAAAAEIKPENKREKKAKTPVNPVINNDIMRYKKNKLGANLALLGLALGCIYFLILYAQTTEYYYTWQIAFDVIYNLFFLLFVFLFSEQVKNYNSKLFIVQLIVGILQLGRICWLPLTAYLANAIDLLTFVSMLVALAASGVCIIASGIIGYIRAKNVDAFAKQLENGEVDLDAALKEENNGGNA